MPAQTRQDIDALMMDVYPYGDEVFDSIDMGTPTLDIIQSGSTALPQMSKKEGRRIIVPLHTKRNPNRAVMYSTGAGLVTPGNQGYDAAVFNVSKLNSACWLDGDLFDFAGGGGASVGNQVEREIQGVTADMNDKLNWLLHQDGSGMYAACGTTTNSNIIQLATTTDMSRFEVDQEVSILHQTDGTLAGGNVQQSIHQPLIITAVDADNFRITVLKHDGSTPAITTSAAHGVYEFAGTTGAGAQGAQVNGFAIMCAANNPTNWGPSALYGGIDRNLATGAHWQGFELAAGNAIFSIEEHVQKIHKRIRIRAGQRGGKNRYLLCFLGSDNWNALGNQLSQDIRLAGRPRVLKGGHEGIEYDKTVFVLDDDAPATSAVWIDPANTYRYIARKAYFDTKPGSMFERVKHPVNNRDTEAYYFRMYAKQTLISTICLTNARVTGLSAAA